MTSQNILSKSTTLSVCVYVCVVEKSLHAGPLFSSSTAVLAAWGVCRGQKGLLAHNKEKSYTNTHTAHRGTKKIKKKKQAHKDTHRHNYTHTCAALRSWSIHDKSKSPPDVRQSNQRAWCSYREPQEPGGDKQWCESSTTTQWPHQPRVMGMEERSYMSVNCISMCVYILSQVMQHLFLGYM